MDAAQMPELEATPIDKELMEAATAGDTARMAALIEKANPQAQASLGDAPSPRSFSGTALMHAALAGRAEGVKILLRVSDPKAVNDIGSIALMAAAYGNHVDCVRLLAPVSDISAQDIQGETALVKALREGGDTECARALIPWGHLNVQDDAGTTALMRATEANFVEAVKLLAPLADAELRSDEEKTALMMAAADGNVECVRALLPYSTVTAQDADGFDAMAHALSVRRDQADLAVSCVSLLRATLPEDKRRAGCHIAAARAMAMSFWPVVDFLSEDMDPLLAAAAFRKSGPEAMPRYAARLEASEIREAIAGVAETPERNAGVGKKFIGSEPVSERLRPKAL